MSFMKTIYLAFILIWFFLPAVAQQEVNIIPYPISVKKFTNNVHLDKNVVFFNSKPQFAHIIKYLNSHLNIKCSSKTTPLFLALRLTQRHILKADYILHINNKSISILAKDEEGLFHGMISLLQLVQSAKVDKKELVIPRVFITDHPRYAWRGCMLDESRHFFGKAEVEKLIDWMAYYKLNRLHWHLTDADGWRIEIKQYPLLNNINYKAEAKSPSVSSQYYSQDDIKAIVRYATVRHISIIPEIDMPGHATAAVKAYPEFSGGSVKGYPNFTFNPGKDATYTFLTNILKEIVLLFPSRMVHVGGDEVAFGIKAWDTNADVISLMAKEHLADVQEVERYFIRRMADSLAKFSKTTIYWDEAASHGLDNKRIIIDWWRHNKPKALQDAIRADYKIVLCPRLPLYFDFVQDSTHLSGRRWNGKYCSPWDVYHFPDNSPDSTLFKNQNIIGLQANLWTETVISAKRLNYLTFPRLAALAEAGWTYAKQKDENFFKRRLMLHLKIYKQQGIYYYDPFNPQYHPEPVDIKIDGSKLD
jgi:hexosaminidase